MDRDDPPRCSCAIKFDHREQITLTGHSQPNFLPRQGIEEFLARSLQSRSLVNRFRESKTHGFIAFTLTSF
jgi:hypothetical protein